MKVIELNESQKLDLELELATGDWGGLDADTAAYGTYAMFREPIPKGKLLARTCGNPSCVNPDHLTVVDPLTCSGK
jgi:hypothetical protein